MAKKNKNIPKSAFYFIKAVDSLMEELEIPENRALEIIGAAYDFARFLTIDKTIGRSKGAVSTGK